MGNEKEDGGGECRSVGDLRGVLVIICLARQQRAIPCSEKPLHDSSGESRTWACGVVGGA